MYTTIVLLLYLQQVSAIFSHTFGLRGVKPCIVCQWAGFSSSTGLNCRWALIIFSNSHYHHSDLLFPFDVGEPAGLYASVSSDCVSTVWILSMKCAYWIDTGQLPDIQRTFTPVLICSKFCACTKLWTDMTGHHRVSPDMAGHGTDNQRKGKEHGRTPTDGICSSSVYQIRYNVTGV